MKYLLKHDVDVDDPKAILLFLADKPARRRDSCLVASSIYYNRVMKKPESAEVLKLPMSQTKEELKQNYRKQEATPAMRKNWVDYKCLKKELRKLIAEVFRHPKGNTFSKAEFHKL